MSVEETYCPADIVNHAPDADAIIIQEKYVTTTVARMEDDSVVVSVEYFDEGSREKVTLNYQSHCRGGSEGKAG
jgi:hypothetical protein